MGSVDVGAGGSPSVCACSNGWLPAVCLTSAVRLNTEVD